MAYGGCLEVLASTPDDADDMPGAELKAKNKHSFLDAAPTLPEVRRAQFSASWQLGGSYRGKLAQVWLTQPGRMTLPPSTGQLCPQPATSWLGPLVPRQQICTVGLNQPATLPLLAGR